MEADFHGVEGRQNLLFLKHVSKDQTNMVKSLQSTPYLGCKTDLSCSSCAAEFPGSPAADSCCPARVFSFGL